MYVRRYVYGCRALRKQSMTNSFSLTYTHMLKLTCIEYVFLYEKEKFLLNIVQNKTIKWKNQSNELEYSINYSVWRFSFKPLHIFNVKSLAIKASKMNNNTSTVSANIKAWKKNICQNICEETFLQYFKRSHTHTPCVHRTKCHQFSPSE